MIPILRNLVFQVVVLAASTMASADQLVVRLESLSLAGNDGAPAPGVETTRDRPPGQRGLPGVLRLPVVAKSDGTIGISLRQQDLDAGRASTEVQPAMRLRLLSSADGSVTEDARGNVAVLMDTTLAFDNLATGESRIFDIRIRGAAEDGSSYGASLPIYVEAWRRGDDGNPIENPTKENRSFWGTLSGSFEP